MPRKRIVVSAVVLAVVSLASYLFFATLGPDGPPQQAKVRDTRPVAPSLVRTDIIVPLRSAEDAIAHILADKRPLLEGSVDRIGSDIIAAIFDLPRRKETKCEITETVRTVDRLAQCIATVEGRSMPSLPSRLSPGYLLALGRLADAEASKSLALAECAVKFGADAFDTIVSSVEACREQFIPLPTDGFDLTYAFSLAPPRLEAINGVLKLEATIDSSLTITQPDLMSTFFENVDREQEICGPSLGASAVLRPFVTADNSNQARGIGRFVVSFEVFATEVILGRPCPTANKAMSDLMDNIAKDALGNLSVVFQELLVAALEDLANDPALWADVNDDLKALYPLLRGPFDLSEAIKSEMPGVLPAEVAPHISLQSSRLILPNPRIEGAGRSGVMRLSPGIVAEPVVTMTKPVSLSSNFIVLDTTSTINDRFTVNLEGSVDLDAAERIVSNQVKVAIDDTLDSLTYKNLSITLYQSGERLVVGVTVSGVGRLGLKAQVFLTARPVVDSATRAIQLEDVKFDIASTGFLSRVAGFVLESPIEAAIESRVAIPVGPTFEALLAELADTMIEIDKIVEVPAGIEADLHLAAKELDLMDIWLDDGKINLVVQASGTSFIVLN